MSAGRARNVIYNIVPGTDSSQGKNQLFQIDVGKEVAAFRTRNRSSLFWSRRWTLILPPIDSQKQWQLSRTAETPGNETQRCEDASQEQMTGG